MSKIKDWWKSHSIKNGYNKVRSVIKNTWKNHKVQTVVAGATVAVAVIDSLISGYLTLAGFGLFLLVGWQVYNIYERELHRKVIEASTQLVETKK